MASWSTWVKDNWLLLAGAGVTIAGAGGLAYWVLRSDTSASRSEAKRASGKRGKRKKKTILSLEFLETALPDSAQRVQRGQIEEKDKRLRLELTKDEGKNVFALIDEHKGTEQGRELRFVIAQYLVMYWGVRTTNVQSHAEYKACEGKQNADMEVAWRLLDWNGTPEEERMCRLLKIDIAQRLKDSARMLSTYQWFSEALPRGELNDEERVLAFTAAPMIGKWADMVKLGALLKTQGSLAEFHQAAEQRPDIPDFKVLYEMAVLEAHRRNNADTPVEELSWMNLHVRSIRIKIDSVLCPDVEKANQIRAGFATDWQEIKGQGGLVVLRFGAVAQCVLPLSARPIPLIGPADSKRWDLKGYRVMGNMQLEQHIQVNRDAANPDKWAGKYTMKQASKPGADAAVGETTLVFDIEIVAQEEPIVAQEEP